VLTEGSQASGTFKKIWSKFVSQAAQA